MSFVYVIKGDHGLSKIGVSTDPNSRLASLQTGSPYRLNFEFIGMTSGEGFDIEQEAHDMLHRYRLEGEWFAVPPEVAVGAVHTAAHRLGYQLTPIHPADVYNAIKRVAAPQITPTGRTVAFLYLFLSVILILEYDDHFLFAMIVFFVVTMTIVRPAILRHFSTVTAP